MTTLGTIVADEVVYRITEVRLRDGVIWFLGEAPGPVKYPGGSTQWAAFGEDGVSILPELTMEMPAFEAGEGGIAHMEFPLQLIEAIPTTRKR